jgi:hypothetical protein
MLIFLTRLNSHWLSIASHAKAHCQSRMVQNNCWLVATHAISSGTVTAVTCTA